MLTLIKPSNPDARVWRYRLVLALLLSCVAPGQLCSQAAGNTSPAQPARRALLIGINEYAGSLPNLRGCVNDVEAMQSVLSSRFGFPTGNICTLKNEGATRQGILTALEGLARSAGRHDTIFILYAGHGSQVPDRNGDEKDDKLDESLVPHDGRTGKVRDITDDELMLCLSRFKTQSVVVVLDCCHSGTGTRSRAMRARMVAPDTRKELYPAEISERKVVPVACGRHLLLTAAASDQCALDGPIDGRPHGFFSYALAKVLSTLPADGSARAVFAGVEREIRRLGDRFRVNVPEPMLEGPKERFDRNLFPSLAPQDPRKTARVAWVEVGVDPSSKTAFLASAYAPGVAIGAVWAIFPPGELDFRPGRSLGIGEVTRIVGGRAQLRIDPPTASLQDGARAFLLTPSTGPGDLPICFRGLAPARAAELEQALRRRLPTVRAVGRADYAVHHVEFTAREVKIFGADGLQQVGSFPVTAGVSVAGKLAEYIRSSQNRSLLAFLDNPASNIRLHVRFCVSQGAQEVPSDERGAKVVADTREPTYRTRKQGDPRDRKNSLQLEIHCNTDCYITIVDVDAAGKVSQLFPNRYARPDFLPEERVTAGRRIRIPDSFKSPNRAGFHWDIAPPVGRDTIGVFATSDKETTERIRRSLREPEKRSSLFRELGRLLTTRGIKAVDGKPTKAKRASDWTATSLTYRIER